MGSLELNFIDKKSELEIALKSCQDTRESTQVLVTLWDELRSMYMESAQNQRERALAAPLFSAMLEGVKSMACVTQAKTEKTYLQAVALPGGKESARAFISQYAVSILCFLSCAICMLAGENVAAVASLSAMALSAFQTGRKKRPAAAQEPIIRATPQVNSALLLEQTASAVHVMDVLIERTILAAGSPDSVLEGLNWTRDELLSIQMLWEAYEDKDGVFALKAVPLLLHSLTQQDVSLVRYGRGNDDSFDFLPGLEPGRTVRPALYAKGQLIARGQAISGGKALREDEVN